MQKHRKDVVMMNRIALQRLRSTRIDAPPSLLPFATPADVVAWFGAIQGQDYPGAKWSLGVRIPGLTDAAVEAAFAAHTLVRTWVMRGTLFFVSAADVRWMIDLVAPRLMTETALRYHQLELDAPTLSHASTVLAAALADGQSLDRPALFAVLESAGIGGLEQRGYRLLQRASLDGLIVQCGVRRNQPVYMAMDARIPPSPYASREAAAAALALRYFTSRGPATLQDFLYWSGLLAAEGRAAFHAIEPQLTHASVEGAVYYWHPHTHSDSPPSPALHLLPGFDELMLGYRDRSPSLAAAYANAICPGGNGIFKPTLVNGEGRVIGTWTRTISKKGVVVRPEPFEGGLSADQHDQFLIQAQRYADHLQVPLRTG
ncbi:MAG: winged helix DNA-binding domain-containing protein [bacterium]|nr:winged helix DNA-binding domain-containing protein [bacterium]